MPLIKHVKLRYHLMRSPKTRRQLLDLDPIEVKIMDIVPYDPIRVRHTVVDHVHLHSVRRAQFDTPDAATHRVGTPSVSCSRRASRMNHIMADKPTNDHENL